MSGSALSSPAAGGTSNPALGAAPTPAVPAAKPAAPAAGSTAPTSGATPAAAAVPANDTHVPVSVVQALRDELKELKGQNTQLIGAVASRQPPPAPAPKDPLDDLKDDEVITVGEVKAILSRVMSPAMGRMSEMQMQIEFPDYGDVVKKYLPEVLKQVPALAQAIKTSKSPYILAYNIGKLSPNYGKGAKPAADAASPVDATGDLAAVIAANAQKPGSPAAAAGSGGLSDINKFAQMDDAAFNAHMARVKSGRK